MKCPTCGGRAFTMNAEVLWIAADPAEQSLPGNQMKMTVRREDRVRATCEGCGWRALGRLVDVTFDADGITCTGGEFVALPEENPHLAT